MMIETTNKAKARLQVCKSVDEDSATAAYHRGHFRSFFPTAAYSATALRAEAQSGW